MRNPITVTILGAFIIGSFFVFVTQVLSGYYDVTWIDPRTGYIIHEFGLRARNLPFEIWQFLYLALGLAITGCGIGQIVRAHRRFRIAKNGSVSDKFTLAQISLGALFIALLLGFITWLEPDWSHYALKQVSEAVTGNIEKDVLFYRDPGWVRLVSSWKVISFLLGMAVFSLSLLNFRGYRMKMMESNLAGTVYPHIK